jgi:transcription elongation factor GreA
MAEDRFILTQTGYDRLQQELEALQQMRARETEVIDDVDEDTGNLEGEEAGAFFEAKTTLEHLDERIGHLRFVLDRADVRTEDPDSKRIDPGERVVVWDLDEKRERTFDILSSPEVRISYTVDDGGRDVSIDSPVGQALLGHEVGDIVEVDVPGGEMGDVAEGDGIGGKARYAIRRIEPMPNEA